MGWPNAGVTCNLTRAFAQVAGATIAIKSRRRRRLVLLWAADTRLILAPWTGVGCGVFEISARPANATGFTVALGVLLVLSIATFIRCRSRTTILAAVVARSRVRNGVQGLRW